MGVVGDADAVGGHRCLCKSLRVSFCNIQEALLRT